MERVVVMVRVVVRMVVGDEVVEVVKYQQE
jgi:hypothetical protein